MPRKNQSANLRHDAAHRAAAAMTFWDRFQQPQPLLRYSFAPTSESCTNSLGNLSRLPALPYDDSKVYLVRVSLEDSKPKIWRRLLIKGINLEILHHVIQLTMGWSDSHLHGYEVRQTQIPMVDDGAEIDERTITISQMYVANLKRFRYTYDFGDDWRHLIVIEDSFEATEGVLYPQCVAGEGAAPLEDIGGTQNWSRILDALKYPKKERDDELQDLLQRMGNDFVPPEFDLGTTNLRLQRAFHKQTRRKRHA